MIAPTPGALNTKKPGGFDAAGLFHGMGEGRLSP